MMFSHPVRQSRWDDGQKPNGDTWLAKIYWKKPNEQMTSDGHERAARAMDVGAFEVR